MPKPTPSAAIRVDDYSPDWPLIFRQLKDRLWPPLCDVAVAIEHVGSTSIPGIAAKPIIDIDIIIASRAALPVVMERLTTLGYQHRGDLGIEDREAFLSPQNQPAHHLYVCIENSPALQNHIALRDHLRSHPSDAMAYSSLKRQLAERFPHERERYVEGKIDFIVAILKQCGFSAAALDAIKQSNRT